MNKYRIPEPRSAEPETRSVLEFRFLLSGAGHSDAARLSLQEELTELLEHVVHLNLLPVNQGLQMNLEVSSTAPFGDAEYEAYLVDHVLLPTLGKLAAESADSVRVLPLRSRRA